MVNEIQQPVGTTAVELIVENDRGLFRGNVGGCHG
jgi:hypothetical protein